MALTPEDDDVETPDAHVILGRLLVRLTTCADESLDAFVAEALGTVAVSIGADHAFITAIDADGTCSVTHEWCGRDVARRAGQVQRIPVTSRPWQFVPSSAGEVLALDRIEDLPPEALEEARFLGDEGARSVLTMPTAGVDGRPNGAVGFHRHAAAAPWKRGHLDAVCVLGNALAGALERRRADAARRESEARYRLLAENTTDNIWLYDTASDRFTYVSPAVERQRGYTPEEVMRGGFAALVMPHEVEALRRGLTARIGALEAGDESVREFTYLIDLRRKNGGVMAAEISTGLVTGPDGKVVAVQGATRNVSERRALEAQLLQAQKMEALGRVAGGMAHDFNNMLSVIIGHAELALMAFPREAPGRTDLDEILAAALRSAELTRQLLAFARKQTIRPRVLDLNGTLAGMLKMLQRLIGEDIALRWQPGADTWPVRVDPGQLDQVLVNLAVNARDAIPGTGRLIIETANVLSPGEPGASTEGLARAGEYVAISVRDTGTGMTPEVRARAFEPFFSTKEAGKGTGLGLSTVFGIVKQNGGFVTLDSEPGEGTTVTVYLPRAAEEGGVAEVVDAPILAPAGKETVLLVEDAERVRILAESMLKMLGYTVVAAGTPGEALEAARSHRAPIDLLLTDVVLPEMNGRELSRLVERLHPGVRCLFMSGYPADAIAQHGVLGEGLHFLQKPFTVSVLAQAVREAMEGPAAC